MIRTLLATTAVAAVMALPVIAQDASSSMSSMESSSMESSSMDSSMTSSEMPMDSSMMSSEPMDTSSMVSSEMNAPFDIVTGYTQIESDRFATRIIGQPVYDSTAADANLLGNITDLVLDESGRVAAVTIGVGGFLGIGEKQVAVSYAALTQEVAADNTLRYVLETTVEELTAAPDFVVVEDTTADDGTAPASADPMAPADTSASSAM